MGKKATDEMSIKIKSCLGKVNLRTAIEMTGAGYQKAHHIFKYNGYNTEGKRLEDYKEKVTVAPVVKRKAKSNKHLRISKPFKTSQLT